MRCGLFSGTWQPLMSQYLQNARAATATQMQVKHLLLANLMFLHCGRCSTHLPPSTSQGVKVELGTNTPSTCVVYTVVLRSVCMIHIVQYLAI